MASLPPYSKVDPQLLQEDDGLAEDVASSHISERLDGPSNSSSASEPVPLPSQKSLDKKVSLGPDKSDIPLLCSDPTKVSCLAHHPLKLLLPNGHFPRSFSFYSYNSYSTKRIEIRERLNSATYMYITCTNGYNYEPFITLFAGPDNKSPRLALVLASSGHYKMTKVDLRPLFAYEKDEIKARAHHDKVRQNTVPKFPEFDSTGQLELLIATEQFLNYSFTVLIPTLGERERFYWEECVVLEFKGLNNGYGERLIRVKTGEVVAGFGSTGEQKSLGRIIFMGDWRSLGQDFEVMTVLSAMAGIHHHRQYNQSFGYAT